MAPWRAGRFWLVPNCDTAVCPGVATTAPDPCFGAALEQHLRETGAPGVVSRERKKADFQSCCHQERVCHKLQGLLSFNQVKGPVVVMGRGTGIETAGSA